MSADVRERVCELLRDGESLSTICKMDEMPAWGTVHNWMNDDPEFDGQVTRAREIGYLARADKAIEDAKKAEDAALGRLAFDAERWYLGKLSNAFSEKQKHEHSGPDGKPIESIQRIERHVIDPQHTDSA